MRVVPQNFVLYGRRSLKGFGLCGIAAVCGSCAKFPPNSGAGFTAINVTFSVAGVINPAYIYDVAIASYDIPNPNPSLAPVPVINSSNPNGRMAGSPTEFVEFPSPAGPQSANPFTIYQFGTTAQYPNPSDPTNLINLGVYNPSPIAIITNFQTPWNGGPDQSTLSFTIYTNALPAADGSSGSKLQSLQLNILTMTRVANLGSGTRVIDALGDSRTVSGLNNFLQINLLQSIPYNNANGLEPTGDTFGGTDPDVDINNFSVTITPP